MHGNFQIISGTENLEQCFLWLRENWFIGKKLFLYAWSWSPTCPICAEIFTRFFTLNSAFVHCSWYVQHCMVICIWTLLNKNDLVLYLLVRNDSSSHSNASLGVKFNESPVDLLRHWASQLPTTTLSATKCLLVEKSPPPRFSVSSRPQWIASKPADFSR